jgi:hypothetical protein
MITVPEIDSLTLDSIFPTPGRNELCHCDSGEKYKRCCLLTDEKTWRAIAVFRKDADVMLEMLYAMPRSIYPEYDPQ